MWSNHSRWPEHLQVEMAKGDSNPFDPQDEFKIVIPDEDEDGE
jgi:hypothetical protein